MGGGFRQGVQQKHRRKSVVSVCGVARIAGNVMHDSTTMLMRIYFWNFSGHRHISAVRSEAEDLLHGL